MSETLKDLLVGLVPITVALIGIFGTVISGNKKTIAKVDKIEKKLDKHIEEDDEDKADGWRDKIIAFNNNLCRGKQYDEEAYTNILSVINKYELFCKDHEKTYKNNKCLLSVEHIKKVYQTTKESNTFLTHIE